MKFSDGSQITTTEGGTMIEGPTAVALYQIIALKSALSLEMHGLKVRRGFNALAFASDLFDAKYPRGNKGREMAIADCELAILRAQEGAIG